MKYLRNSLSPDQYKIMHAQFLPARHYFLDNLRCNLRGGRIRRNRLVTMHKDQFKGFSEIWIHRYACGLVFT